MLRIEDQRSAGGEAKPGSDPGVFRSQCGKPEFERLAEISWPICITCASSGAIANAG